MRSSPWSASTLWVLPALRSYTADGACDTGLLHKLRTRMFAGMQKLPIRYFDQNSRGDITSYYTNDIDTLRQLVSQSLPQLFAAGLTVLGLLLFMFFFSIPLMLIVFLGIFCMTKVTKNVGGRSAKYFLSQQSPSARSKVISKR